MSKRLIRPGCIAALALLVLAAVPALAATRAPSRVTVAAVDRPDLRPNRELGQTDDLRWLPAASRIRSGGRLTLKNRTPGEVHNFSIVTSTQIPRTQMEALVCGSTGICRKLNDKHEFDANTGQPRIAVVNRGRRGIDRVGDSVAFSGTRRVKVTARAGSTLRFICAVHPHMQGKLRVGR